MNSQDLPCPMCKTGILQALPNRERPSYYLCRLCREKFRADYRLDPQIDDRVFLLAVRQNPQIEKELAAACSGSNFMERVGACVAKLDELKKQGVPMELETFCIGYEDAEKD